MANKFKIGDTVRVADNHFDWCAGMTGIIEGDHETAIPSVKFPGETRGHYGEGTVFGSEDCWYIDEDELTLVEQEQPVRIARPHLSPLCTKVLKHIERCGHITARDAMIDLDITSASLARRICDLEDAGINIQRLAASNKATGKQYTRYSLEKAA